MSMPQRFTFRKHSSIGAAAAEDDASFLKTCFTDTGELTPLLDCHDPKRLVLGRTGSGKSAIIWHLRDASKAIDLDPQSLAFNHITNSTVLQFFLAAGVKLDLFFRLLWRHAFTVELLKWRYNIRSEAESRSALSRLWALVSQDRNKERALKYIQDWGPKFWENTEVRLKELTVRVEEDLKGSVSAKIPPAEMNAARASKLSQEDKLEVVQRGQTIINSIQMKELTNVLRFLDEDVFNDDRQQVYVCVDRLDEHWVDDQFRYLLIRSLIETIRDFLQVQNVKIIVVLRTDLLEQVFRRTRDSGFQEEKYRSLYLRIRWSQAQLLELLDKRINHLVRQTYTKAPVTHRDLLGFKISRQPAIDYMIERTSLRPRELIEFFNCCIECAEGKPTITKTTLLSAEGLYSKYRLRSLQDEWITEYPGLIDFSHILKKRPSIFSLAEIKSEDLQDLCLRYSLDNFDRNDQLSGAARTVAESGSQIEEFKNLLFYVFYRTGIVGLKISSFDRIQWSFMDDATITPSSVSTAAKVAVHPMYQRVLGIGRKSDDTESSENEVRGLAGGG
jgi:hypothetical protein